MSEFDFAAAGVFSSTDDLVPLEIKLSGETGTVFVRRLPAMDLRRFHEESQSEDIDVRLSSGFKALAKAIRREDGSAHMTTEQAKKLKASAFSELMRVFVEANKASDPEDLGNA